MNFIRSLKNRHKTFRAKIFYFFTALIITMYLAFAVFFIFYQSQSLKYHLITEGKQLASLLAYNTRIGVFAENRGLLKDSVEGVMQNDEVILARVFDANGEELYAKIKPGEGFQKEWAKSDSEDVIKKIEAVRNSKDISHIESPDRIDFWIPVISGGDYIKDDDLFFGKAPYYEKNNVIGFIRLVLTKKLMKESLEKLFLMSIMIPVIFIVPGWIIAYFIIREITRPLTELTAHTSKIAMGDFTSKLNIRSSDEIGTLAESFNNMIDSLEMSHADLLSERDRAQNYFNVAGVILLVLNMKEEVVLINKKGSKVLGYPEKEIEGKNFFMDFLHEKDAGMAREMFADPSSLHPGAVKYFELPVINNNGDERLIAWHNTYLTDKDGRTIGTLSSGEDITERTKAEELLRFSENKFRKLSDEFNVLLDAIPDNILLLDRALKIVWANKAAVMEFGLEGDKLTEISCYELCCKLLNHDKECPAVKSFETGSSFITQISPPDGRVFDIRVYPIKDESGRVKNVIEVMRNITHKIQLEQEARFMQAKLLQANKMTALGTLVSGVAHEINNPNSFIMGNAELLSIVWKEINNVLYDYHDRNRDIKLAGFTYAELQDMVPKLLEGIDVGSKRIQAIIANLKDFSRPENTSFNDRVDLNEVIRTAMSMLNNQIRSCTDHFKHDFMKLPHIKGNKQKIEQVIINLLSNALQSLPDKERGIHISTHYDNNIDSVIVTIKDEGVGMTDDVMERITEPFFTTKIDSGGTGLGLYISYAIISDHNGSMKFESKPAEGTTVVIQLPSNTGEQLCFNSNAQNTCT